MPVDVGADCGNASEVSWSRVSEGDTDASVTSASGAVDGTTEASLLASLDDLSACGGGDSIGIDGDVSGGEASVCTGASFGLDTVTLGAGSGGKYRCAFIAFAVDSGNWPRWLS